MVTTSCSLLRFDGQLEDERRLDDGVNHRAVPVLADAEADVIYGALGLLAPGPRLGGGLLNDGEVRVLAELRFEDAAWSASSNLFSSDESAS